MANEVHLSDIGVVFQATIKDDGVVRNISGASTIEFLLDPPSGGLKTLTGSLTTDGTDGKCEYTTVSGDLDETGTWEVQVKITEGSTPIFHASIDEIVVKRNLV
jgi:hypothetical protein